jgi:putative Mg2+ transporter-C (MgtC) family protein
VISEQEIVLRLLLGALFGGIIGFERQVHGRPAGFRTHMLVCVALVLLMIVSENYYHFTFQDPRYIRIDPARIAMGAITGVGFLGAGVIIKTGVTVQGLTTAASIWMVSAIGLALGGGLYMASIWSFAITLFTLFVLRAVEGRMSRMSFMSLSISSSEGLTEETITSALKEHGAYPHNIEYEKDITTGEMSYRMTLGLKHRVSQKEIFDALASLKDIRKVSLRRG